MFETGGKGGICASADGTGVRSAGVGGGAGRSGTSGSSAEDPWFAASVLSVFSELFPLGDRESMTKDVTPITARTPPIKIHGGPPVLLTGFDSNCCEFRFFFLLTTPEFYTNRCIWVSFGF
jgi:hypothetical protein